MIRRGTALLVAAALSGCQGGGGEPPKVATARTEDPAPTTAPATRPLADDVAEYLDAMRGWAACVRENGVDVSDPDPKGVVTFPGGNAAKADPGVVAAQKACRHLLPPVPEAVIALRRPALTAEQLEVRRRYADCMQRNGAPDFPDPGPDGYADRSGASWDPTTPAARRAARECAPIIGDPVTPGETHG